MTELTADILKLPEVENVISISGESMMGGGSGGNMGSMFVVLKPWNERRGKDQDVNSVIDKVNEIGATYQEPIIFSINPPAIPGLGMTSGLQMQILDINNLGVEAMEQAIIGMKDAAKDDSRLAQLTTQFQGEGPQYEVKVNRDKAKMLGLTLENIYATLSQFMGGSFVNDFVKFGRTYQVTLSADSKSRGRIDDIPKLAVRNTDGEMVPFSAFADVVPSVGQATVSRYNMYNTASITGTPAKGVSGHVG